ncbi:hypothetical protein GH714_022735 [Hevea brasiliensis]|uniref:Uncharacterized protein n=1 Tax=Hevea brasiliensis TaxID=3981 RepID=A0A6A6M2X4_HEVBR|nr:hypothetical protein GH714_022735 [Hevea brasiliensis]
MPMATISIPSITKMVFFLLAVAAGVVLQSEARAFFVFGDSLVDSGNNNYLATTARADSPPYGIDYPTHRPTGRFSNGLNIPDIISERIGAEPVLPYLSPELTAQRLLNGANFASAGIGILNDTGVQFLNIIRMDKQLECFQEYQQRVRDLIGGDRTKQLVNGALILIAVGGNDFVNNYYLLPYSARSRQFPLPDYVKYLISEYKKLLMELYKLGARRVLVTGTGPLGCVPAELALRGTNGGCSAELQRAASLYNPQLVEMLKGLNKKLAKMCSSVQIHKECTRISSVIPKHMGQYNGLGLCTAASNLCPNRGEYAFWDPFHPSEKANRLLVEAMFSGSTNYMVPMNLRTIMALDARN